MIVLQMIGMPEYMELLLSDDRAVRVPGVLKRGAFVGNMNANWLYVNDISYEAKKLSAADVCGRASLEEKREIIKAVSSYLRESSSATVITFE